MVKGRLQNVYHINESSEYSDISIFQSAQSLSRGIEYGNKTFSACNIYSRSNAKMMSARIIVPCIKRFTVLV